MIVKRVYRRAIKIITRQHILNTICEQNGSAVLENSVNPSKNSHSYNRGKTVTEKS